MRSSRAATGGDAASNSDKGDGAASETRMVSETPGSAIITDVSCLAQLRGWLRGDGSGGNLDLLYSSSRVGSSAAVFHSTKTTEISVGLGMCVYASNAKEEEKLGLGRLPGTVVTVWLANVATLPTKGHKRIQEDVMRAM